MSMQQVPAHRRVVIGVDTHKYVHVAVALDDLGTILESRSFSADSGGYVQLLDWAAGVGGKVTFTIEGTGSYAAGLTSAVRRRDIGVIEVMRTDRRDRRLRGKSDTLDAENAARAVLAGHATAIPKSADGMVEMIRQVKVAKDVAVQARTSAMISLKQVIVNAPPELREELQAPVEDGTDQPLRRPPPRPGHHHSGFLEAHAPRDRAALAAAEHRDRHPREGPREPHNPSRSGSLRGVRGRPRHRSGDADRGR